MWLWWVPLHFMNFMTFIQRTLFFPTQCQDISTSRNDTGAFPYIFISWKWIHMTKIMWLGNSSLYAIAMLVDISLHLLGQGTELVSFNSAPGCVASAAQRCSCWAWRKGDGLEHLNFIIWQMDIASIGKKTVRVNVRKIQDCDEIDVGPDSTLTCFLFCADVLKTL